jgi:cytochrome c oxidase subunit II
MFSGASNFAMGVDKTFLFIMGIAFIFLIGITTTMIVFAVKYNRKKHPKAVQFNDNIALEITWTLVPVILVLLMFYYGYINFTSEREAPKDAIPVKVIAKMWDWTFDYGNGKIKKDTLVVPLNKAVKLNMVSLDVNHSLYISAFRIKEDVVPGTTTTMWFIAQQTGNFDILCAEFCGLRHSYMEGIVKVVSEQEYKTWLAHLKITEVGKEPKGYAILKKNACVGCHSTDGSKLVGPSFKNLYMTERIVLTDGKERKVVADSMYIKNSIYNPDNDVVKTYSKGLMHSYQGVVKEAEVTAIVEYLKTLNDKK